MPVERILFLTRNRVPTAHEQFRVYSPLKQAGVEVIQGFRDNVLDLARIQDVQLVLFQRGFSRSFGDYQAMMKQARQAGIPVILDLDDDMLALPSNHPDRISTVFAGSLVALLCAILEVDAITVTTPTLKEAIEPYNPNVFVLPNYLDAGIWDFRPPAQAGTPDPVRLLFMGTPTHGPDLEMITDALIKVARRHGDHINFLFFGLEPPAKLARAARTRYLPLIDSYEYQPFVREMQSLEADIAIAPLADNPFNRSKSAIKYFEYSAMGLPGIYSRIEPYATVIQDGVTGFLADDVGAWEEKINLLVEDRSIRQKIATLAQEDVRQNWLIGNHAGGWLAAYDQIMAKGKRQPHDPHPFQDVLNSIAVQLEEGETKNNSDIAGLKSQVQLLSQQNQALSDALDTSRLETIQIALSTSWRITRPLRKLGRFLRRIG